MKNKKERRAPKEKKHEDRGSGNAARISDIISSPTEAVRVQKHTDTWSNTGTNISYEEATAPGGGGAAGTGQTSGKDGVDARITTQDPSVGSGPRSKSPEQEEEQPGSSKQDEHAEKGTIGIP